MVTRGTAASGRPRSRFLRRSVNRPQTSMCHRLSSRIIEVPKMAEQILDVLVPEMVEQLGEVVEDHSPGQNPAADCGAYRR